MEKMFETAIRNKFRLPYKGLISIEDLWDLTLEELDTIFKTLNAQINQVKEESLLAVKDKNDEVLEIKIAIIRYIVATKQAEAQAVETAKARREQKQKIMAILADKQNAELQNKSVAELEAMLAALD